MSDPVQLLEDGPVARLVLSRPELSNALDDETIRLAIRMIDEVVARGKARVLMLSGEGKHFCAGADLNWMKRSVNYTEDENLSDARELAGLFQRVADCPIPVVARVQGAAIGGGAGLVSAADIAVAADTATFGFSEVRLGLIPAVISPHVIGRIGAAPARVLFLTGRRFSAPEAHRLGLVDKVVPAVELEAAADEIVGELLAGGVKAQGRIKLLVREVTGKDPASVIDLTARAISAARTSAEAAEGMASFLEKRKPSWATSPEK